MKQKKNPHIEINSEYIPEVFKQTKEEKPLLEYLSLFENDPRFQKKTLKKGELLFDEWDVDNFFYIIVTGMLIVEKYTTMDRTRTKMLAFLKPGDFVGESSLSGKKEPKEARIKALEQSTLLYIDGKEGMKEFILSHGEDGYEFLKILITEGNKRLKYANIMITIHYEIEKLITHLKDVNMKSLFNIIQHMHSIIQVDYILYFEKHPVLENYLILRYDSRYPGTFLDMVFEQTEYFLNLDLLYSQVHIHQEDYILINKIHLGEEVFWFFIFGRKQEMFSETDKKILLSMVHSLAGIIKKIFLEREERDKNYLSDFKQM